MFACLWKLICLSCLKRCSFYRPFQLSFDPTPCTRTTDPSTTIDITNVAYTHRFQVTSILFDYQFTRELSDINSDAFETLAAKYETEVSNQSNNALHIKWNVDCYINSV